MLWAGDPVLLFMNGMTSGKLLSLSEPQFSRLWNGARNTLPTVVVRITWDCIMSNDVWHMGSSQAVQFPSSWWMKMKMHAVQFGLQLWPQSLMVVHFFVCFLLKKKKRSEWCYVISNADMAFTLDFKYVWVNQLKLQIINSSLLELF